MAPPEPPSLLPKYLAEGIPKQDLETLRAIQSFVDKLIEYRTQPVDSDELPETAEPVEDESADGKGTIVKEMVTCGDENCSCADGDLHGPYLYRYYRVDGELTSEYLGKP
ncbi:DUF6788 family protein [Halorhabdus rudnickae]|uniref:DUF6788 family protein n=1 Tax=Halorhabdus rudnickae TaxID=1775544 RepID=UPI0010825C7D|nr:DUF6788 family protein [Halorhabdus rudnickae]